MLNSKLKHAHEAEAKLIEWNTKLRLQKGDKEIKVKSEQKEQNVRLFNDSVQLQAREEKGFKESGQIENMEE